MADKVSRPMEYPYTFTAKMVQFPYKLYFTKQWIWKTMPLALAIVAPIWYKIGKASYSEENVAKWKEIRKHDREPHIHD